MLAKINIKNGALAVLFTTVLTLLLFQTMEKPLEKHKHMLYLQLNTSAPVTLLVTETTTKDETLTHLSTPLTKGSHVVALEPQYPERFTVSLSNLQQGDTLYLKKLMYLRGNTIRLIEGSKALNDPMIENGQLDIGASAIVSAGDQMSFSFSADAFVESSGSHLFKRVLTYGCTFLVGLFLFLLVIPAFGHFAWKKVLGYLLFSSLLGLGLYTLIESLTEFPNRTVVDIEWDEKPGDIYGIMPTPTASFSDAKPVFINPNDPAAVPTLLISRLDPLHALRIDVDPASQDYFIRSLTVHNALAQLKAIGLDLPQVFPLVNDAKLKIVERESGSVLHLVPTGADPYVIFYSAWLPYYRILDGIIFSASLYLGLVSIVLIFTLLIRLSYREKLLPVYQSWFPIVFLILLFTPGVIWLFSSPTPYFPAEKRRTNNIDGLDTLSLSEVPSHIERYISDHFGARSAMIGADNIISVVLFNETNALSTVDIGKEGWMFYTGEGVQAAVRNEHPIDTTTLNTIRRNLLERQHWIESHGSKLFFAFPPMKPTVYEEFLPNNMKPIHRPSRMETIINYLESTTDLKIINLYPTIMEAKKGETRPLYYKRDTHWNHLGAFYAYQAIVDTLNNYFPQIGDPKSLSDFNQTPTTNNLGDLPSLLGLQDYYQRDEVLLFPKYPCDCVEEFKRESPSIPTKSLTVSHINQDPVNNLSLFVFRDSYANYILTAMNPHFEESVYLWTYGFFPEAFDDGYPNLVVYEVMERFISDLAIPNPPEVSEFYQTHLDSISIDKPSPQ